MASPCFLSVSFIGSDTLGLIISEIYRNAQEGADSSTAQSDPTLPPLFANASVKEALKNYAALQLVNKEIRNMSFTLLPITMKGGAIPKYVFCDYSQRQELKRRGITPRENHFRVLHKEAALRLLEHPKILETGQSAQIMTWASSCDDLDEVVHFLYPHVVSYTRQTAFKNSIEAGNSKLVSWLMNHDQFEVPEDAYHVMCSFVNAHKERNEIFKVMQSCPKFQAELSRYKAFLQYQSIKSMDDFDTWLSISSDPRFEPNWSDAYVSALTEHRYKIAAYCRSKIDGIEGKKILNSNQYLLIRLCLEAGDMINMNWLLETLSIQNTDDFVLQAGVQGKLEALKSLIRYSSPIHEMQDRGYYLLFQVARAGKNEVVWYLLERSKEHFDLSYKNNYLMEIAKQTQNSSLVEYLKKIKKDRKKK